MGIGPSTLELAEVRAGLMATGTGHPESSVAVLKSATVQLEKSEKLRELMTGDGKVALFSIFARNVVSSNLDVAGATLGLLHAIMQGGHSDMKINSLILLALGQRGIKAVLQSLVSPNEELQALCLQTVSCLLRHPVNRIAVNRSDVMKQMIIIASPSAPPALAILASRVLANIMVEPTLLCTSSLYKGSVKQEMYTASFPGRQDVEICSTCAKFCHRGTELPLRGMRSFRCECSSANCCGHIFEDIPMVIAQDGGGRALGKLLGTPGLHPEVYANACEAIANMVADDSHILGFGETVEPDTTSLRYTTHRRRMKLANESVPVRKPPTREDAPHVRALLQEATILEMLCWCVGVAWDVRVSGTNEEPDPESLHRCPKNILALFPEDQLPYPWHLHALASGRDAIAVRMRTHAARALMYFARERKLSQSFNAAFRFETLGAHRMKSGGEAKADEGVFELSSSDLFDDETSSSSDTSSDVFSDDEDGAGGAAKLAKPEIEHRIVPQKPGMVEVVMKWSGQNEGVRCFYTRDGQADPSPELRLMKEFEGNTMLVRLKHASCEGPKGEIRYYCHHHQFNECSEDPSQCKQIPKGVHEQIGDRGRIEYLEHHTLWSSLTEKEQDRLDTHEYTQSFLWRIDERTSFHAVAARVTDDGILTSAVCRHRVYVKNAVSVNINKWRNAARTAGTAVMIKELGRPSEGGPGEKGGGAGSKKGPALRDSGAVTKTTIRHAKRQHKVGSHDEHGRVIIRAIYMRSVVNKKTKHPLQYCHYFQHGAQRHIAEIKGSQGVWVSECPCHDSYKSFGGEEVSVGECGFLHEQMASALYVTLVNKQAKLIEEAHAEKVARATKNARTPHNVLLEVAQKGSARAISEMGIYCSLALLNSAVVRQPESRGYEMLLTLQKGKYLRSLLQVDNVEALPRFPLDIEPGLSFQHVRVQCSRAIRYATMINVKKSLKFAELLVKLLIEPLGLLLKFADLKPHVDIVLRDTIGTLGNLALRPDDLCVDMVIDEGLVKMIVDRAKKFAMDYSEKAESILMTCVTCLVAFSVHSTCKIKLTDEWECGELFNALLKPNQGPKRSTALIQEARLGQANLLPIDLGMTQGQFEASPTARLLKRMSLWLAESNTRNDGDSAYLRWKSAGGIANIALNYSAHSSMLEAVPVKDSEMEEPSLAEHLIDVINTSNSALSGGGATPGQGESLTTLVRLTQNPRGLIAWLKFDMPKRIAFDYTGTLVPAIKHVDCNCTREMAEALERSENRLVAAFPCQAFRHRGWARPLHVSDEFETETKGDDDDEDDHPSDRWGAVFSRHSVILLKDGGVPMGDDWTISVWFRGGSWLDPARRQHAGHEGSSAIWHTLCESSMGDKILAIDHRGNVGCLQLNAPHSSGAPVLGHDFSTWHASTFNICKKEYYEDNSKWFHLVAIGSTDMKKDGAQATELFCSDGDGKIGSVGKIKGYRYSGDMFTVGNCLIAPSGDKIHAGEPWGPIADFRLYPFQMSQNGEDYWPEDMKLKPPVDDASAANYQLAMRHQRETRSDYITYALGQLDTIPALVGLLGSPVVVIKTLACRALANLGGVLENRNKIVSAGAMPLLLAIDMDTRHPDLCFEASRALISLF